MFTKMVSSVGIVFFFQVNANVKFQRDMIGFSELFLDWVHISASGPYPQEDGIYYKVYNCSVPPHKT